jgi:cell division protein FtsL
MSRDGRLASLLLTGMLVVAVSVVFATRDARAQTARSGSQATSRQFVGDEWRLRGVILAEPARFAVLQHGASSRLQLLRVGDVVERGIAVVSIAADRVILDAEGRAITLRLAHGGERVSSRRPVPRRFPSPIINQRGR